MTIKEWIANKRLIKRQLLRVIIENEFQIVEKVSSYFGLWWILYEGKNFKMSFLKTCDRKFKKRIGSQKFNKNFIARYQYTEEFSSSSQRINSKWMESCIYTEIFFLPLFLFFFVRGEESGKLVVRGTVAAG